MASDAGAGDGTHALAAREMTKAPQDAKRLARQIRESASRLGFDDVGIAALAPSQHGAFYRAWLDAGRHGTMHYLARPDAVDKRTDPKTAWPGLKSAIVLLQNYRAGSSEPNADPSRGVVARYARGRDYHRVLKPRLIQLIHAIEAICGHALPLARAYVDTGPVLERELAQRAGLGWFGRNTMLIQPRRGSYFFLATLLLEIEPEADAPFATDHCGSCRACLDACPTGALLGRDASGAPVIDARRCIAYLTIEQRGPIPRELRPHIGNRIFGCDICQEVCPWNEGRGSRARAAASVAQPARDEPRTARGDGTLSLIELMDMDAEGWNAFSRGRAIRRATHAGFLRNVAVALGNWGAEEAVPVLALALEHKEPLVRGHAAWALGRIASEDAQIALRGRESREADAWVQEELRAALGEEQTLR